METALPHRKFQNEDLSPKQISARKYLWGSLRGGQQIADSCPPQSEKQRVKVEATTISSFLLMKTNVWGVAQVSTKQDSQLDPQRRQIYPVMATLDWKILPRAGAEKYYALCGGLSFQERWQKLSSVCPVIYLFFSNLSIE